MGFNFKKISAIASSVLLTGMTMGVAAAANYPAPFVSGGSADVAIVYGTGAGVSALDQVEATNIQSDLSSGVSGGTTSTSGGDSYLFEDNDKFHVGDKIGDVVSTSLDDDELGDLLADSVFVDDDNDEFDYKQQIVMANHQVVLLEDEDDNDEIKIGVKISDGSEVLTYKLDFTDKPEWEDLETSDLTLMGKEYYILDAVNTSGKLTLLDSAVDTVLNEGESKTVLGHDVSISFIGSNEVKFIVDGQTTNALNEGETQKLSDGSYIGVKEILVQDYQGGQKQVEFSIGSGKLVLEDGKKVDLNDDKVNELNVSVSSSGTKLNSVAIQWNAEEDLYIVEDNEELMPGFESVKLSFGGVTFPEEEKISVDYTGNNEIVMKNFPTKESSDDIYLLEFNKTDGATRYLGREGKTLKTSSGATLEFNDSSKADDLFIGTYVSGDDGESYLLRFTDIEDNEEEKNTTTIQYKKDGSWIDLDTDLDDTDDVSIGQVEFNVDGVYPDNKSVFITRANSKVSFNTLVSEEGMLVTLPVSGDGTGATVNLTSGNSNTFDFDLIFQEEDEDDSIGLGQNVTLNLSTTGSDKKSTVAGVTLTSGSSGFEIDNTEVDQYYMYSALATEVKYDYGDDEDSAEIVYHGSESSVQLYITAPEVTVVPGEGLGNVVIMDSEVSSMSDKNLVVVGGSCINSVAANLLGGALCGPAFMSATGVGSGQFLIESMESPYDSSKVALLVAGYEVADTQAASAYLRTQDVDTSVGKKYVGTSSTSAELVVE